MAIIVSGYELKPNKQVFIALQSIYGVGKFIAFKICKEISLDIIEAVGYKIDPYKRAAKLTAEQINAINNYLRNVVIGDDLKKSIILRKRTLIEINAYKGKRYIKKLPVRGQRTKSNASTVRKIAAMF